MSRTLPLAALVVASLAACQTPPQTGGPAQPMPKIVTNVHPYTAGNGVVQSVSPAPTMAAAGSSSEPLQRLEVKMDNGTVQYVDTTSRDFSKGQRITLTEDKLIRRM
jgi:hypothetical protein